MAILVKCWGLIVFIAGAACISNPAIMKQVIRFWIREKMCYLAGLLNLVIALFLLLSAARCKFPWFIDIIGILSLLKGITIFMLGPSRCASMMTQLLKSTRVSRLRFFAFILLVIGALLVYSA
jgi:hypothetical protein